MGAQYAIREGLVPYEWIQQQYHDRLLGRKTVRDLG